MNSRVWCIAIAAAIFLLDQATKYWVTLALRDGDAQLIRGLVNLTYTRNPGIAFGLLSDGRLRWALVAASIAAIALIIFYVVRSDSMSRLLLIALSMLAGGISGNLVDRIRTGFVIDFIEVYYRDYRWPVFNIADATITIGAALLALDMFLGPRRRRAQEEKVGEL